MGIVLSRKEYVELAVFGFGREYPKSTLQAVQELRERGFDATEPRLSYMLKRGIVCLGKRASRNLRWQPQDIDRAGEIIAKAGNFTPEAQMNLILHTDYAQRLRALLAAWRALDERFPGKLPAKPDSRLFIMHVHPRRLARNAWVEYAVCDDVIEVLTSGSATNCNVAGGSQLVIETDGVHAAGYAGARERTPADVAGVEGESAA